MTAAVRGGLVSSDALVASPRRLARGEVWLLVSNGVLVQRPVLLSLVSFVLLSMITLYLCGSRVFVVSALVGHVGSTLLAYSLLVVVWSVDTDATRGVAGISDYGVSAMQTAWIGAIAATAWRRRGQTPRGRLFVVVSCLGVGVFAWLVRSDLTLLDTDHLFAFAIGATAASAWCSRDAPSLPQVACVFMDRLASVLPSLRRGRPAAAAAR